MLFSGTFEERVLDLKRELHTRVELYTWEGRDGAAGYRVDLRRRGLRGGRAMLRDPRHPAWPEAGSTTTAKDIALAWVDEYVDRLGPAYFAPDIADDLVSACAIRYLVKLEETKGRSSSTYRNRASAIRVHILPVLEHASLGDLTAARVQDLIDNMVTVDGRAPADATREGVLAALTGIWKTAFPTSNPPWAGEVTIKGEDPNRARRERATAGIRVEGYDGYTPDDLRWILVGGYALDLYRAQHPRRGYAVVSVVDELAFLIFNPVRVEEGTFGRAKDADLERNVLRLIGTKTPASEERWMPIQAGYEPWLARALARCDSPEDYLLPGRPGMMANVSTVAKTIGDVLVACDRKRPGERTKIFRGTHISLALGSRITAEQIAAFAGHEVPGDPLLTSHYLRWGSFLAGLPEHAWDYMPHLGTPDEIEALAREALRSGALSFG